MPDIVVTAVKALRNKCRHTNARRETPLPSAVRAKLRPLISSTAARVVRKIAAAIPRLKTRAGKMICWKFSHGLVNRPTNGSEDGKKGKWEETKKASTGSRR